MHITVMEVNNPYAFISQYHNILREMQPMCLLVMADRIVVLTSYTI